MATRIRWLLYLVSFALIVSAGVRAQSPTTPDSISALLETSRVLHHIPALAMVATRSDVVLETAAVGVRRDGRPDLVTAADRFHIGSDVKAMTATMLATLVEGGQLSWNTTPSAVFTEAKDSILTVYRDVTLTDLLAHRSGLPAYDDLSAPEFRQLRSFAGTPAEQRRDFALWVLSHKPAVAPHKTRLYSNAGYAVAAAMAERVTGQGWESLMRTKVFEPLGIHPTFEWPAFDDPAQPWGHFETKNGVRPHDPHDAYQLPVILAPAGSLSISPNEYAKFMQLHLLGLEGHDGVLKAETIRHLHTRVDEKTALGWGVKEFEGAEATVHTGSAGTFYAVVALWPSRDLALAVFANAGDQRADAACVEILKAVAHRYNAR
jgi:CubicO group peptidase (beta-lactamase class C family)